MLADQAVVVPSETTERLAAAARDASVYLVIGVEEREPTGGTIYNTLLYFDPDGQPARQASQAHADRFRADRLGDGRRLDARDLCRRPSAASVG